MGIARRSVGVATLATLAAVGFWLGAFAWFGGYGWLKETLGFLAVGLGLVLATLARPRRLVLAAGVFAFSQILFIAMVAAGQVFYAGPSSPSEAAHLFSIAIRGGL